LCISTGINTQVSVWPLEYLLQVEFLLFNSRYFVFLIFLLVLLSFFSSFWSSSFPLLFLFFFHFFPFSPSCPFLFLFKLLIFYLFFVWTSGLSFCLIILVFARMSLRVNISARWFLMILQACWVSVCWGGRLFEFFIKKITSNPHYLITLKNSWFFISWIFLINPTSVFIPWLINMHNNSYYYSLDSLDSLASDNCPLLLVFFHFPVLPSTSSFCEGVKKSRRRLSCPDH
jgi:hypothetical protein